MDAGSELQPLVGHVGDGHLSYSCHQVQCHLGDLVRMSVAVPLRETAHHHVRIADGLHLVSKLFQTVHQFT